MAYLLPTGTADGHESCAARAVGHDDQFAMASLIDALGSIFLSVSAMQSVDDMPAIRGEIGRRRALAPSVYIVRILRVE